MFITRLQTHITFKVHELIKQNIRLLIWVGALTGYYPVGSGMRNNNQAIGLIRSSIKQSTNY